MKIKSFLSATLSFLALQAGSLQAQTNPLVEGETEFAFSLYNSLNTPNLIISPFSLSTCLLMTYLGAREETAKQMEKTLFLTVSAQDLPEYSQILLEQLKGSGLHLANALWVSPKTLILTQYRRSLEKQFGAHLGTIDFTDPEKAESKINSWISQETQGKISSLLHSDDLKENTRLVLTNAVYFEGAWLKPFDAKKTLKAPFFISSEKQEEVDMMEQTTQFFYSASETFQSISLPLKDTTLACVLILPKQKDLDVVASLKAGLEMQRRTIVHLRVPKFSLQQRFSLNDLLKNLGMTLPFSAQANFSGIDGLRDLYIDKIIHESYFSFDEEGIVASSGSVGATGFKGILEETIPVALTFDRPFSFFLVDLNSKTILFMGRYSCSLCP